MDNIINQFSDAIKSHGITIPDNIIFDGKIHRFSSNGKPGDDSGWYVLHSDGIPAGGFGDWRTGVNETWRADIGRQLTKAEIQANNKRMADMRKQSELEKAKGNEAAAAEAEKILQSSKPAPVDFSYLVKKGIKPHGTRIYGSKLAVPMRDTGGKLWNIESISADGEKKGLRQGRRSGCYYSIGSLENAVYICICEGFATGASIHEATGLPVAVAFDCGNLRHVAEALHAKYQDTRLVICSDDDYQTEGNPGRTAATKAVDAVGGLLVIPDFGENRPEGATDFNDQHQHFGIESVKSVFYRVKINSVSDLVFNGVTGVTGVTTSNDAAFTVTPQENTGVTGVTGSIPEINERPTFRVFDNPIESDDGAKYKAGVWYFGIKPGKNDEPPILFQIWICSPLHVEAMTFDGEQNNFGRLLRFKNSNGCWREWAMPMGLLGGSGEDLRIGLLDMGVEINPESRGKLANYLQDEIPKRRMHCAMQTGWCNDVFVLPDVVIGEKSDEVIFQHGERSFDEYAQAGALEEWQTEIAARAVGNPLLMLALSAAFAGPLLNKCHMEGGGIHFVGDSSTGKTTAIEAACSVWGGKKYRRSWRATSNGMEGAAALFNDCLLALDEISECDPREVGAIVYALGNGVGKQRAGRAGNARSVTRWRCFVLSSGERSIPAAMAEGGRRSKAGQTVRLLDLPAARKYGARDEFHSFDSGTAFSDSIKTAAAKHYGHAGRAFLEKLTRDKRDFCGYLEGFKGHRYFQAEGCEGQAKRAAARFALLAVAGELATEYGITGWAEGEALNAAGEGFKVWLAARGTGNDEKQQILKSVADFIDRHGNSRFSNIKAACLDMPVINRAGYWDDDTGGSRVYLFTGEGMREALKGFDFNRGLDALQEVGALPEPGADGKRAKNKKVGRLQMKLYCVSYEKLTGGDHGA